MQVPAHLDHVGSTGYATSLRAKGFAVGTVEHFLAVLHSYGITNLLVKVQGRFPFWMVPPLSSVTSLMKRVFRKKLRKGRNRG